MEDNLYLGHTAEYWLELEKKAKTLDVTEWLQEIATLRAKVSFYESRLKAINDFTQEAKSWKY